MAFLKRQTFKGVDVEIGVDEAGRFFAPLGDGKVTALTLRELEEKIERALRTGKITIDVPFTMYDAKRGPRPAKVTGIHATSGDFLIRYLDGKREAGTTRVYSRTCGPVLDPAVLTEGQRLAREKAKADLALSDFMANETTMDYAADLKRLVAEAMEKAAVEIGDGG